MFFDKHLMTDDHIRIYYWMKMMNYWIIKWKHMMNNWMVSANADPAISMDLLYFALFPLVFMCRPPVDPAAPLVLNNGGRITYVDKWRNEICISLGCRLPTTKWKRKNNLAKAGSSWKSHFPWCSNACMYCRGFQFQKCKSKGAGAWRRHGLDREWAPPAAHFQWKCLFFVGF